MGNLILIGFMGSGKSEIGRRLAAISGFAFLDTDALIEAQTGKKIADIFHDHGESHFRDLESALCRSLAVHKNTVIATGGGMPIKSENQTFLKNAGTVFFLSAPKEILYQRVKHSQNRPLLKNFDMLFDQRQPIYEKTADQIIMTEGRRPGEVAKEIWALYGKLDINGN